MIVKEAVPLLPGGGRGGFVRHRPPLAALAPAAAAPAAAGVGHVETSSRNMALPSRLTATPQHLHLIAVTLLYRQLVIRRIIPTYGNPNRFVTVAVIAHAHPHRPLQVVVVLVGMKFFQWNIGSGVQDVVMRS